MTDLAVTAASVVAGANSERDIYPAGEAIAAGKAMYLSATTKKFMLADSNSDTVAARRATHIALNSAALNQPMAGHRAGDINFGTAILTAGSPYFLSDTPGGICPLADVGSGEAVCQIGIAKSTSVLAVDIQFPNVTL